jgi:GrpB-like predicted nucleotidyltransferase (UPF0157 family)
VIDKNEIVTFVSSCSIKESIESTYNEIVSEIKQRFPDVSTIHIGSSSVDDLLTKGDLDILVIANSSNFQQLFNYLNEGYEINSGVELSSSFASFKDDSSIPNVGIQLALSLENDYDFLIFQNILLKSNKLKNEYNGLKKAFDGKLMVEYRAAKSDFIEKVLDKRQKYGF